MDTSSESDSYGRTRSHRHRGHREAHRRPARDGGGDVGRAAADVTEKIGTLADTLQDTSRNLTKVDRMLSQYRDHTDDQAEAMALLRENLEASISQLQTQRLSRSHRSSSSSASTLHTSDLEACSGSDGQHFCPTSPLRDYTTSTPGRKRRSRSAGVRFRDSGLKGEDIHAMHQSLRDLHCDQQRLSTDLDREVLRRNRCDLETRRAMESLTGHLTASQRPASVSSPAERERRADQRATVSDEPRETSGRRPLQAHERTETVTARLLKAEREKSEMEQEVERARRLLEQSEDSKESLAQQVEDMRGELLRTRKEKTELQRARTETLQSVPQTHSNHTHREDGQTGAPQRGPDGLSLEKEVADLRVQLRAASALGEVEELKRALDRTEKKRVQLSLQVEDLSSDLARREQQQLRMLEQLREIQAGGRQTEASLRDSVRSREELRSRAQEAVRQWRAKCRRLQKELEEMKSGTASQTAKEKESSQSQLKVLSKQSEAAHRELSEALCRLAQREEQLHRKDVELSESRQRHLPLEQEIREARDASAALKDELKLQAAAESRLREENRRLEERADGQARHAQREREAHAGLQASLERLTSAHAQLAPRLEQEESANKELRGDVSELRARLTASQEERDALGQQLRLQREVHRKELDNMKAVMDDSRTRKEREVQDTLKLCLQERDEIREHLKEVKADAVSERELCGALRLKLDRMKNECDKLAAQLSTKDEAHSLLHRKYQQLKQDLEGKARSGERRRASESELVKLEEKLLRMETDQESVLTAVGQELDAACRSLAKNGDDKLQAISQKPGLVKDPHRWLAETKTKVRWLCEEVRECGAREQCLRRQHRQTRDQWEAQRQGRDSEQRDLLQRLDQQEKLLHALSTDKRELLEKSRRKEEEMRSLQDRVLDLEMNTRVALDHLESMPEKSSLMENFEDLEESQRQRDMVEQRYTKYKEIVWDLQHQLDQSKRRIQEYREEKRDVSSRSLRLTALSSSIKGPGAFLNGSPGSDTLSPHKRLTSSDLDDSAIDGTKPFSDSLNFK